MHLSQSMEVVGSNPDSALLCYYPICVYSTRPDPIKKISSLNYAMVV